MSKDLYKNLSHIQNVLNNKNDTKPNLKVLPSDISNNEFLNSSSNNEVCKNYLKSSKERYNFDINLDTSNKEYLKSLEELKNNYDKKDLKLLIESCKESTIQNIIGPFGLAGTLFKDKLGGNVDTIHNVRNTDPKYNDGKGIYASDENKKIYENRDEYNYSDYHDKNDNYKKQKDNIKKLKSEGKKIKDDYTNLDILDSEKASIEHIKSASDIHNDPAIYLAGADPTEIANLDSNLLIINGQLNSSINSKSPSEYLKLIENAKNPEAREKMIEYLNNKKKPLTDDEKKLKRLLEQKNAMIENKENVLEKEKKAEKDINKNLNKKYYGSKKFIGNLGKTSAKEGMNMGIQQSIGLLVKEFTLSVFDEISDIFATTNDIKINSIFIQDLKKRLMRISNRVLSKWKDIVVAFKDGAISGFFSNIITVIINTFLTTSKNVVKIIREGLFSLLKALKLVFCPPENLSKKEAAHEATKLIASSIIVTGSIAIEETLEKSLLSIPVVNIFANKLSPVVIGILTGLCMAFVTYTIDKLDIFKVNEEKKHEYISTQLDDLIDNNIKEFDNLYNSRFNPIN